MHDSTPAQRCPDCCADRVYADRCPAAQISADQASQLLAIDGAVAAALERLAETEASAARAARTATLPEDAKFFQRSANAYTKALCYWLAGVRPERTANGYVLPSQRPGEAPHKLTLDGDWICTCAAGQSMHWAKALVVGLEVAQDDQARFGDAGDALPAWIVEEDAALLELLV